MSARNDNCGSDGWWEERTLPEKIALGVLFALLGIGAIFLFGWIVMLLWNWLMPDIFGLPHVTYWQAWGLMLLSCIFFKGFGSGDSGGGRRRDRRRRKELRRYMSEETDGGDGNVGGDPPGSMGPDGRPDDQPGGSEGTAG